MLFQYNALSSKERYLGLFGPSTCISDTANRWFSQRTSVVQFRKSSTMDYVGMNEGLRMEHLQGGNHW